MSHHAYIKYGKNEFLGLNEKSIRDTLLIFSKRNAGKTRFIRVFHKKRIGANTHRV